MDSDDYDTNCCSSRSHQNDNTVDDCETAESPGFYPQVATLFDQAVRVVAKHKTCEELEQNQPPLDEALLKKIAYWSCPQDIDVMKAFVGLTLRGDTEWRTAETAVSADKVKDMIQVGFMVTAVVGDTKVSFTFERQNIMSTYCHSCSMRLWCSHLIAAVLYRIEHASEVPVHGPMTETLSTLDKDQMQKLIQYAVSDSPGEVLTNIFKRIDQVRDSASELRQTAGAPDPTFGIEDSQPSVWELSIDELKKSFDNVCSERMNQFQYSFCEKTIKDNWIYKAYLQRVVDLARRHEIEAAGRVLITLTTVAARTAQNSLPRSKLLLKTLERMCSLYILQFTGDALSDLILLCQNINRVLNFGWTDNIWADLPPLSALHTGEFLDVPGVLGGVQTSFFYEPVCVSLSPDPPQGFNELLNGTEGISSSTYDEPLPLMMLRFEALRLWRQSDDWEQQLARLGFAILKKLLQMSFHLSILKDKGRILRMKEKDQQNTKKRKAEDELDDTIAKRLRAKKTKYSQQKKTRDKDKISTNASTTRTDSKASHNFRAENVQTINKETDKLLDFCDVMGDLEPKTQGEMVKMPSSISLFTKSELLKSLFGGRDITESVHKETISYCLLHTCCCIYEVLSSSKNLKGIDNDFLALATLMALEFARFRTAVEHRGSINTDEHAALKALENKAHAYYNKHTKLMKNQTFSSGLHKIYMKFLCECNLDGVCFFDSGVPLLLISTLVETSLADASDEDSRNIARCLCLYTLCHSYKPVSYYTSRSSGDLASNKAVRKESEKQFEEIMSLFLKDIRNHPERRPWLIKVLEHYVHVQDMEALHWLWNKTTDLAYDSEPREVQTALARFMMQFIKVRKDFDPYSYSISKNRTLNMMIDFCSNLGVEFMNLVFANWIEVVTLFDTYSIESLMDKMKELLAGDLGLSADMKNSISEIVSGKFQHDVRSCELLTFLIPGDKFFGKTVGLIRENIANFTPEAVLFVAKLYRNHQVTLSEKIPSGKVFSNDVECLVKNALTCLCTGKKPCHSQLSSWRGSFLPCSKPYEQILWVFKAFSEKPEKVMVKCRQFTDILAVVRDVFSDDLPTIVAICSSVEDQKLLHEKCKSVFAERIHQLINDLVFEKLNNLTHKRYKEFVTDLETIQGYFAQYVPEGQQAFVKLVNDIKRGHKSKRKLIDMLGGKFHNL